MTTKMGPLNKTMVLQFFRLALNCRSVRVVLYVYRYLLRCFTIVVLYLLKTFPIGKSMIMGKPHQHLISIDKTESTKNNRNKGTLKDVGFYKCRDVEEGQVRLVALSELHSPRNPL